MSYITYNVAIQCTSLYQESPTMPCIRLVTWYMCNRTWDWVTASACWSQSWYKHFDVVHNLFKSAWWHHCHGDDVIVRSCLVVLLVWPILSVWELYRHTDFVLIEIMVRPVTLCNHLLFHLQRVYEASGFVVELFTHLLDACFQGKLWKCHYSCLPAVWMSSQHSPDSIVSVWLTTFFTFVQRI